MIDTKTLRTWMFLAVAAGAVFFLASVFSVLLPFVFGIGIAYLVQPLVDQLVSFGLRRDRIVIIMYLLMLGIGIGLLILMVPLLLSQAGAVLSEIPNYAKAIDQIILKANGELKNLLQKIIGTNAGNFNIPFRMEHVIVNSLYAIPEKIIGAAHLGVWLLVIPFVSFFALAQGRQWIDFLFELTPSEYVEGLLGFFAEINTRLGGYIRGVIVESSCVGLMIMAGLAFLGVEGAVFLGVVSGVLNVVPFLAPVIGGGFAILMGYFQGQPTSILIGIFLLFAVVRLIDDFFLFPIIVGSSVRIHPIFMVFAILAGTQIGGFLGLVFAIPVAVLVKVILAALFRHRRDIIVPASGHVLS